MVKKKKVSFLVECSVHRKKSGFLKNILLFLEREEGGERERNMHV